MKYLFFLLLIFTLNVFSATSSHVTFLTHGGKDNFSISENKKSEYIVYYSINGKYVKQKKILKIEGEWLKSRMSDLYKSKNISNCNSQLKIQLHQKNKTHNICSNSSKDLLNSYELHDQFIEALR